MGGVVGGIMGDGLRLGDSYWQLTLLPPGVLFPFKASKYQLIHDIICAQHCVPHHCTVPLEMFDIELKKQQRYVQLNS